MTVYADTSFLVSSYVRDAHAAKVYELLKSQPYSWFTPLHEAEWAHAIAQHLFWQKMSEADASQVDRQLKADRAAGVWRETAIPDRAFDVCAELGRHHGPKLGVRTLDTLHVACALELKAERFWTFDERQAKLAKAAGLKIT